MKGRPQGWVEATIGEVADASSGFGFPKHLQGKTSGRFPFAKVGDISAAVRNCAGRLSIAENYVDDPDLKLLKASTVRAGSTVFAKIGEGLKLNRRALTTVAVALDNNCMALSPCVNVEPQFLFNFLRTVDLGPLSVATTVPSIRKGDVEAVRLLLPPFAEQRRIVAKIDSLSGKSKRAREQLDRIPRLVEKYKQAVLAAAFRGELTQSWRGQRPVIRTRVMPNSPNAKEMNGPYLLPQEWTWQTISQTADIGGGLTKNAKRNEINTRRRYLRVANVYANELRLDDVANIGCTDREFEKTRLRAGDLLIVEGNGSVDQIGRVAIWNGEIVDCVHQNHLIRVRPREGINPNFSLYWLLSPAGREQIEAVASSSSGLHTLSISKVAALPIPLCSTAEQNEIVGRIEHAFTWIDRLAGEATSSRRLVDHLDHAILSKAFRGALVPQDPNDEPAKVLLERIRAQREATPQAKQIRKRRKAK